MKTVEQIQEKLEYLVEVCETYGETLRGDRFIEYINDGRIQAYKEIIKFIEED